MSTLSEAPRTSKLRKPPVTRSREWTDDERRQIAEMAYQRFLARGGQHGYELEDWLQAEAEFAASLAPPKRRRAAAAKD